MPDKESGNNKRGLAPKDYTFGAEINLEHLTHLWPYKRDKIISQGKNVAVTVSHTLRLQMRLVIVRKGPYGCLSTLTPTVSATRFSLLLRGRRGCLPTLADRSTKIASCWPGWRRATASCTRMCRHSSVGTGCRRGNRRTKKRRVALPTLYLT